MFMDLSPESIQKMMLTPKMLLSMHVLQLNIMDLRVFMRAELDENPLLEEETVTESSPDDDKIRLEEELSRIVDDVNKDIEDDIVSSSNDEDNVTSEQKRRYLQTLITKEESLYEHLLWQLQVLARNDEEKRIGEFIIGNLDNNGFLNMELEEMRKLVNADIESFKRALTLVRSLDPPGVGARNLKESLLIQLISIGKGQTHLYRIIYSHLEDLGKGYFEKIAKALSIPAKEVKRAKKRIAYLNPKPGANFGEREFITVIEPDLFLNKDNGTYSVEVSETNLPKIRVNRYYKGLLKDERATEATKEYIKKKFSSAMWLIDALSQRRRTIVIVCGYLVSVQKDFLEKGDIAIKPLTLKQVADELSISEATVSRVVSNKYAQISNSLCALRDFFAGQLKTTAGNIVSDRSVKQKIQDFIKGENPKRPLSDENITSILNKIGISISRRTVTKYREDLGILPSYLRRKKKI
jgi:RNA polymerase sigma-54 factor